MRGCCQAHAATINMEANEVSHSVFVPVSPRSKHHLTLHRPVHATAATEERCLGSTEKQKKMIWQNLNPVCVHKKCEGITDSTEDQF